MIDLLMNLLFGFVNSHCLQELCAQCSLSILSFCDVDLRENSSNFLGGNLFLHDTIYPD